MNIYLTVMVTVLVISQIIRVTQNHISLKRQEELNKKSIGWVENAYPSERDFAIQREVYRMLYTKLADDLYDKRGGSDGNGTES